ncbi:Zn(2+)-responsive transcriptional regulator [Spongiibacter sp. KMU-158]|uniref:Zn(2+)-responsive transcriptional regulator n=1 Tax=Spongiibacter pelagi TaxID=2760804 RepID=A0A927C170_9GAMM|nr:Zn(2+)-responsive transcriptional regulator [Spongiibacter pelagi]MBD2858849.1 Zn(2+)-responsive transcriptional regulator [Spongiibacter pelagi]
MTYRIGELAQALDCSVDTLRFYEKQDLLKASGRSPNGYRFYNDNARRQLAFILRAKAVGFSLEEIRELLEIRIHPAANCCEDVKSIAQRKLELVNAKLQELEKIRRALDQIVDACVGGSLPATECSILEALELEALELETEEPEA